MSDLNLSENLIRLRRERKVTQEQLAEFVGVTKASVSKWETRQSMPDLMLLPQLAAYFDVTIDELLGYEPQLSREQIKKLYLELADAFAKEPFAEVMERSRRLVKQYYSCYSFLFWVGCLWLNHCMLTGSEEGQNAVLMEALELCDHILEHCKDIGISNDTILLKANIQIILGRPQEVVDALEELYNPRLVGQGDGVLIRAYEMLGDMAQANRYAQISMFNHLMALLSGATEYVTLHMQEPEVIEKTRQRMERVIDAFDLEHLHFNSVAVFYYQLAIAYATNDMADEAILMLTRFVDMMRLAGEDGILTLHGDDYFDCLDYWIDQLELGGSAPRDRSIIFDSAVQAFCHPAFSALEQLEAFQNLKKILNEEVAILWKN